MAKWVFVCHPLRGGGKPGEIEENIEIFKRLCKHYALEFYAGRSDRMTIGTAIYFTQFLDDNDQCEREAGIRCGHSILEKCDEIDVYTQRGISVGMKTEIELAKKLNKTINYINKYPWE